MDGDGFTSRPLERWSLPVNFARDYRADLETSASIIVLLNTQVLRLEMDGPNRIGAAQVASEAMRARIAARRFVLATGGIETPRLLLLSACDDAPNGIGNTHDTVGRYYMGHLGGIASEVEITDPTALHAGFEMDGAVHCRRRWQPDAALQQEARLRNIVFFLTFPRDTEGHRDPLFSSVFVAKSLRSVMRQKSPAAALAKARELWPATRDHLGIALRGTPSTLPKIVEIATGRRAKRRLPFVLPAPNARRWGLFFQAEQAPNRNSRVSLSPTGRDRFDLPKALVHIDFLEEDIESVIRAHDLLARRFAASGAARFTTIQCVCARHSKSGQPYTTRPPTISARPECRPSRASAWSMPMRGYMA